jgi:hypothetical protein
VTYRPPAPRPCDSCPYRLDVPSGIWHPDEYRNLPLYDEDTAYQPTNVFLCHQQNGRVCAGWAGCHDGEHLLALRLAVAFGTLTPDDVEAVIDYVSPIPLWSSGVEAAEHGMADIPKPGVDAQRAIDKLARRRRAMDGESKLAARSGA